MESCEHSSMASGPVSPCYLDVLPPEVLLRVLSSLSTYDKLCVRGTCRRLYSVTSDGSLWTHVVWHYCRRNGRGLVCALKLANTSLKKLEVYVSSPTFIMSEFSRLIATCPSLQCVYLNLGEASARSSSLKKFLQALQPNSRLSLFANEKSLNGLFSPHGIYTLKRYEISHFANVQFLEVPLALDIDWWASSGYHPPYLKCQTAKPGQHDVSKHAIFFLYSHHTFHGTEAVDLDSDVRLVLLRKNLDEKPHSNAVCLSHVLQPYVKNDFKLIESLPSSIRSISLANCFPLRSEHLAVVARECPNLISINLTKCRSCLNNLDGLAAIVSSCVKLTEVNLRHIHRNEMTDSTKLWEILSQIPCLKSLAISHCLIKPNVASSTAESASFQRMSIIPVTSQQAFEEFQHHLERMSFLKTLQLTGDCRNSFCYRFFTDAEFRLLTKLCGIKHLYLDLPMDSFCSGLTEFLLNLKHLTVLSVKKHRGSTLTLTLPTEPSVYQHLEELVLDSTNHEVRNEFVSAVTPNSSLVYIDFNVKSISETALVDLAKNCQKLVNFNINLPRKAREKRPKLCLKSLGIGTICMKHKHHSSKMHW